MQTAEFDTMGINMFHIPGSNVISFSIDPQVFPQVPGHLSHLPYHLTECFVRLWSPNSCLFPVSLHLNSFIKVTYWHLFIFLTDLHSWPRFETPNIYFGINKEANREPNKWSVTAERKFQLSIHSHNCQISQSSVSTAGKLNFTHFLRLAFTKAAKFSITLPSHNLKKKNHLIGYFCHFQITKYSFNLCFSV